MTRQADRPKKFFGLNTGLNKDVSVRRRKVKYKASKLNSRAKKRLKEGWREKPELPERPKSGILTDDSGNEYRWEQDRTTGDVSVSKLTGLPGWARLYFTGKLGRKRNKTKTK